MTIFSRIGKWIINETLRILPAVIYFLINFQVMYFILGLRLPPGTVRYFTPFTVTIIALVMGKVVLVVNAMPFIELSRKIPLVWHIVWKFFIYSIFIFLFTVLETAIELFRKYKTFIAWEHLRFELVSPILWATEIYIILVFFNYLVASEFVRVLGKDKVMKILFG